MTVSDLGMSNSRGNHRGWSEKPQPQQKASEMPDNSIHLNAEALQQIVAKTLFESIDPAERDRILTDAIAKLLEPTVVERGYNKTPGPSVFEQAFQNAAAVAANQVARDRVQNDPAVKAAIDGIITETVTKLADAGMRDRIATKIAEQIIDGIRLRDY